MRKSALLMALCAFFLGCVPEATIVRSSSEEGPKIGVIDTPKILRYSKAARETRDVLLKDLEAKRTALKAKQYDVRVLQDGLKRKGQALSPSERKRGEDRLSREMKALRRMKSDLEEDLKKKELELTQKLLQEIRELVQAYLGKGAYTVILEKNSVMAADGAIDITDEILTLYNARKR